MCELTVVTTLKDFDLFMIPPNRSRNGDRPIGRRDLAYTRKLTVEGRQISKPIFFGSLQACAALLTSLVLCQNREYCKLHEAARQKLLVRDQV